MEKNATVERYTLKHDNQSCMACAVMSEAEEIERFIRENPALTDEKTFKKEPKHGVVHRIRTIGQPCKVNYRRMHPQKLKFLKLEIEDLERLGIIRKSDSEWANPIAIVPKKGGEQRLCGDFRLLNEKTLFDQYPLPRIDDILGELFGKRCFTVIDLKRGYHQVPVHPEDVKKTAINTQIGLYEYLRMPFGLVNAGKTFQR